MKTVYYNPEIHDNERRRKLYEGDILVYPPFNATTAFCRFTREMLEEAFKPFDPLFAQFFLPVELYVEILKELKPKFIHHDQSKRFIQRILKDCGCDPDKTYFDVPRLRTATSNGYLTSGIAYAFHPHRDTWYSAPQSQLNWWIPIYDISPKNCLGFHQEYWNKPVRNDSNEFSYREWIGAPRKNAYKHVARDSRLHPRSYDKINDADVKIIPQPGGMILFSAAHMHSSINNTSGKTRFSIDFRTINIDDVRNNIGAPNLDADCQDYTYGDFIRLSDLSPFPTQLTEKRIEEEQTSKIFI